MSGLEGGAAVFSLVVGAIEIIHRAIEIYEAVNDKSGVPKALKKVSEKLPSVEEILKSADAQRKAGALKDVDKMERLWKGAKTVLSGKGKTAEALLKELSEYLTLLAQRKIVNNTTLLEDIKALVEELCPQSTTTQMHNINGDNIGTLHGDKNVNSGSGYQFTGAGGTYNFGGGHSEETQWLVEHEDFRSCLCEDPTKHRLWLSGKVGSGKSTLVTTVIDQCRANLKSDESSAVLMFFFHSQDDMALSFFESLTKQPIATLVATDVPGSPKILPALETAYGNDISRPHIAQVFEDLVVPLCRLLKQVSLVMDGIDECKATETNLLWHWLAKLLDDVQPRILITSEDQANISPRFKGFHRIRIDHQHNQFDIDTYIEERIASKSSAGQVLYDESLRNEVKATLRQKANGMWNIAELLQKRGTARLIDGNLFLWVCAAPKPLSIGALGELLAMDLETGHVDTEQIPFADVLLQSGAGLIAMDTSAMLHAQSNERPLIPVHSTVRKFIFSERFRSLAAKASHQESWPLCAETGQWTESTFRAALGSLCLSHIKRRSSRELGKKPAPTRLVVTQPETPQSMAWLQKILIRSRPKPAERAVTLQVTGRNRSKVSATNFLRYAIKNWLVCNKELPLATARFPWLAEGERRSDSQITAELFEEVSIERNDSYGIHPWDVVARTSNSHLSQMFAYAVAKNHVPLMQVVRKHRHSLPNEVFNSPLAQHG
ncbi:hypothetical protein CBER1_10074 [Cercospora berteroae]|uniref:NACHT domain-containing protein n=1 Tax=Cercospora berteroae TaxID=357750 RepID=A0A2S6C6M5_9PEZI|nr:hypothetical protein CBER1_10074 [Cercospora berteroae]